MCLFFSFPLRALIAQSVEHGANNARVVGSSPTGSIFYLFFVVCALLFEQPLFLFLFLMCLISSFLSLSRVMLFLFDFYLTGDLAQW